MVLQLDMNPRSTELSIHLLIFICLTLAYTGVAAPLGKSNNESGNSVSSHLFAEELPIGQSMENKVVPDIARPRLYVNEEGIIVVPIEQSKYKELYAKAVTKRSLFKKKKKKCKRCNEGGGTSTQPVVIVPVTVNTGGGGCRGNCHAPPPPKPCGGTCGYYPSGGGGQSFAQASASATAFGG